MKKLIKDFKDFAVKGNMIEIAIGVIIGAAFNKVVDVLVKQVMMPPLALLTDGLQWEDRKIILREAIADQEITEIAIGYGKLVEATVDFIVVAITIFMVVKAFSSLRKKAEDPKNKEVETPKNIELLQTLVEINQQQTELMMQAQGIGIEKPDRGKKEE